VIIKVDYQVAGDDEFMRCGSSRRKERKTEKGLEKIEDERGR